MGILDRFFRRAELPANLPEVEKRSGSVSSWDLLSGRAAFDTGAGVAGKPSPENLSAVF